MTDITTKADLIAVTQAERQRLEAALAGLDDATLTQPGTLGPWSIKDVIAHVVAWEQELLGWYRAGLRGEVPELPDSDNIDPVNAALHARHRDRSLDDIRAEFVSSYRAMLAALDEMSEDDLFTLGRFAWTRNRYPLAVFFRANADEHYAEHADQLEAWRQAEGL